MPTKKKGVRPSGKGLFIDGPNQAKRVQTFSSDSDFNEERLLELGNKEVAEKSRQLSNAVSVEFNNYGTIATFMQAVGQGMWAGENNANRVLTDTTFDNASCEFITLMSNDDISVDHSEWNGYDFLTSFNFSYPADGIATESYDYEGSHVRKFLNDWKNASVYKADYSSGSQAIVSGVNLESTHNPILLLVNQDVVAELSDANDSITLTDNSSDTLITATNVDGAISFTDGDRIRLIVSGTGSNFNLLSSTPEGIGGLRRGNWVAKLYNPAGNAEKTLRIQNVSIDGDLTREELIEGGTKHAYERKLQRPINVQIAIDVNETDLEEYAKLAGQETAYDASTLREINLEDLLRDNTFEILEYKDEVDHTFANELRRIKITNVSMASDNDSTSVGDVVGTGTLNLTAENFTISGTATSPFL